MGSLLLATSISLKYFPSELQETVINELLTSSGAGRDFFYRTVVDNIRLPGFTSNFKAPPQIIFSFLRKHLPKKTTLARRTLVAWLYLDLEACKEIADYIDEKYSDEEKEKIVDRMEAGFEQGAEVCDELLAAYQKHRGEPLGEEETLRFVGVVFFRPFLSLDELPEQAEVAAAVQLEEEEREISPAEILENLEKLPPEDSFWDSLDEVVKNLEALRDEKLAQRINWQAFADLLIQLEARTSLLDYFGLDCPAFSAETILPENVNEFVRIGTETIAKLDLHNELLSTIPQDMKERQSIQARLSTVEPEILQQFSLLTSFFTQVKSEKEEEPEDESEHETAGETGTKPEPMVEAEEDILELELTIEPEPEPEPEPEVEPEPEPELKTKTQQDECVKSPDLDWQSLQEDPFGFWWQTRARKLNEETLLIPEQVLTPFFISEAILLGSLDGLHLDLQHTLAPNDIPLGRELGLAIGTAVSLSAAYGDSSAWLQPFGFSTALDQFIEVVREFGKHQIQWKISAAGQTIQARRIALTRTRERARTILEEVADQRFNYARAGTVYAALMSGEEELGRSLRLISQKDYQQPEQIQACVRRWGTREHIQRQILDLDVRIRRRSDKEIIGHTLSQLIRLVEEHVSILKDWLELILPELEEKPDFIEEQRYSLQEQARRLLPQALADIETEREGAASPRQRAGLELLQRTVRNIQYFLELTDEPYKSRADLPSLGWYYSGIANISQAFARRLLWFPNLTLGEEGLPLDYADTLEVEWRLPSISWMFEEGIRKWTQKQDFRFTRLLLALDPPLAEELSLFTWLEEQVDEAQLLLAQERTQTDNAVQKALVAGMLTDVVHARHERIIAQINPSATKDVAEARSRLRQIRLELKEQTDVHVEQLRREWEEKRASLVIGLEQEEMERYETAVSNALADKDVRLLRELIESKAEFIRTQDYVSSPKYYKQFLGFRSKVEQHRSANRPLVRLCMDAIKRQRTWAGIVYGHLPPVHRNQAIEALQAWDVLFSQRPSAHSNRRPESTARINKSLQDIFSFIGFAGIDGKEIKSELMTTGSHWLHFQTTMSSGVNARPFPQFGSLTNDRYDIICVWERPGADSLAGFIHDARLEAHSTIILFFGRLSDRLHREIASTSRKRRLETAVLDESLLIFLTSFSDARISAFLRASLPASRIIPYTPNLRGDVPNEIFYGREELVNDLQSVDGPCLMYGGRQMGKSALLRQVQRRFHDPKRMQYAWVEEIQHIGDSLSGSSSEDLWPRIWRVFERMELVQSRPAPDGVDEIIHRIDSLFYDNRDLRVLLLLDEADAFLNRDSLERFKVVSQLRKLMVDHQRRFRVVFTGLHNVQRFQSQPNQPLAHFGTPIRVGPLEPVAAMNLVREPLEALGFVLNDACVLRILSFTNYHPGLIQVFCSRLLEQLYGQARLMDSRRLGPVVINPEIIDNVYLSSDVRGEIKERFELTLSMDVRYYAIALYLVIHNRDQATSKLQPANVYTILQGLREWWPDVFADMANDEFRGLMTELENLGVVVEDHEGAYQLRSPNLVSLMGTDEEIQDRFLDLIAQPRPDPEDNPDSYHALIEPEEQIYSPLTFQQERSLNDNFDFRLITCSKALGLKNMEIAIKNIAKGFSAGVDTTKRLSASVRSQEDILRFLRNSIDQARKRGRQRLVVYQILQNQVTLSLDAIKAAWTWFSQYTSKSKPIKLSLFFVMDPQAFRQAQILDEDFLIHLDDLGLVLRSRTWDMRGIDQRLRQFEKNAVESVRQTLLRCSGGWPWLLDDIMLQNGGEFDPSKVAEKVLSELISDGDARIRFLQSVGIDERDLRVLAKLAAEDVPVELARPDILELEGLSETELESSLRYYKTFDIIKEKRGVYLLDPVIKELVSYVEI